MKPPSFFCLLHNGEGKEERLWLKRPLGEVGLSPFSTLAFCLKAVRRKVLCRQRWIICCWPSPRVTPCSPSPAADGSPALLGNICTSDLMDCSPVKLHRSLPFSPQYRIYGVIWEITWLPVCFFYTSTLTSMDANSSEVKALHKPNCCLRWARKKPLLLHQPLI